MEDGSWGLRVGFAMMGFLSVPKARPKTPPAAQPRLVSNLWIYAALAVATLAVYAQAMGFDFVNFDDPDYVTRNAHVVHGLTGKGIAWALTSGYGANWFPLTWISHMLDCQFFGLDAGWHHLTNILIHVAASLLLFAFLRRATGARWPSAFVSFLFALHPLHVESVAWIAERKDVLSAAFWFLALWAYVRYSERPDAGRYALVAAAFCCGLMAKPMIVTLPFVLLLLDFWPLRRRLRIREKLPLLGLSAMVAAITFEVQQAAGAVKALDALPLGLRVQNAVISYVWYIWKMLWPSGLAVFYPFPARIAVWETITAGAALAAITIFAVRAARTRPHLAVGWLWFLGTLVPVIGLVQVGMQARADRYLYVPMVGLGIMLAWSAPRVKAMAGAGVAVCIGFASVTVVQAGYWRNSESLFRHALEVTTNNSVAEHNLGAALLTDPARLPEAIAHLEAALRLRPDSARIHSDLGSALAKSGQLPKAAEEFRAALALEPGAAIVHNNLGNVLAGEGHAAEAIAEYQAALRMDPDYADAKRNLEAVHSDEAGSHYNAGVDFARQGRGQEAVAEFEACLRIDPGNAEAHNNLGVVLSQMPGKLEEAIAHFETAVKLKPDYEDARFNLKAAQEQQKGRR